MNLGLEILVIWADEHMIELRIKAANGRFAGEVETYANLSEFMDIATSIQGFPTSIEDSRMYILGSPETGFAGGMARMELRCLDSVGHLAVNLKLRDNPQQQPLTTNECEFSLQTNPGDIDSFVRQLLQMTNEVGKTARLSVF